MMKAVGLIFSDIFTRDIPELTDSRTLASVPFAGRYRLIDFALSNMVNSGINNVGIITKYNYQSLMDHVGSGKHWDLSRKNGGLVILPPFNSNQAGGVYNSRFEAINNVMPFIKNSDSNVVIMSDCDIVCNFDYTAAMEEHKKNNADFTMIYREKDIKENDNKSYIMIKNDVTGRVVDITDSPINQAGKKKVYAHMLIANKELLVNIFEYQKQFNVARFTHDILFNIKKYNVFAYKLQGFYSSIDGLANYFKHSMQLLNEDNKNQLFKANNADIFTKVRDSVPLKITESGKVTNSIVADGCVIEGEVHDSILFRDVHVGKGAVVQNSIVFQGGVISNNSKINCVIMDKNAKVLEQRRLSGHCTHPYFIGKRIVI